MKITRMIYKPLDILFPDLLYLFLSFVTSSVWVVVKTFNLPIQKKMKRFFSHGENRMCE